MTGMKGTRGILRALYERGVDLERKEKRKKKGVGRGLWGRMADVPFDVERGVGEVRRRPSGEQERREGVCVG